MKTIILFRHGKSRWDENVADHHRSLNQKGIDRSQLIAKYLKNIINLNDYSIHSSFAKRALQTAEIASNEWNNQSINTEKELYTFSTNELTTWIKQQNTTKNLIIFGHNPAFTHFINLFTDENLDNLWTSGLAKIDFDIDAWSEIKHGELSLLLNPKTL